MNRSAARPPLVAWLLAVGLPMVVLALALAVVDSIRTPDEQEALRELANAGRVVNGERVAGDEVQFMEAALDLIRPEVLVLGNSTAHTNVDVVALADGLGVDPERVLTLSQPNSVASHWYAVLAHRVFARGHRPSLVIVVGQLRSALLSEPYSEASRQSLLAHLEGREPILDRYVERSPRLLERLRWQRHQLRTAALTRVRDAAVGAVFGVSSAEPAMERVFHHSNLQSADLTPAATASTEGELPDSLEAAVGLPAPEDSLLGPLADLVGRHDATLVLVRPPMAPRTPPERRDVTLAGVPEAVAALLSARGHGFVDLGDHWLPGRQWDNLIHTSEEGARRLTREGLVPGVQAHWPPTVTPSAGL